MTSSRNWKKTQLNQPLAIYMLKQQEDENKNRMKKILLLISVGFAIDITAAIIIYNVGKGSQAKTMGLNYKWKLPDGKELLKTTGLVLVTSVITGTITSLAEKSLLKHDKQQLA